MGLGDIVPEENEQKHYRQYADHELQDELEDVVDNTVEKLPGEVEIDFIEVSPRMTSNVDGRCYHKENVDYIRLKEDMVDREPWEYVKRVVRHEVIHAWFRQNGYEQYRDGSKIFEWVCGRVDADITGVGPNSEQYEIMEQFR